jgi:hypothetical protein
VLCFFFAVYLKKDLVAHLFLHIGNDQLFWQAIAGVYRPFKSDYIPFLQPAIIVQQVS